MYFINVDACNIVFSYLWKIQYYAIEFVNDLRQFGGFLRVLRFSPSIKLSAWYNWNSVERGVKHHKLTLKIELSLFFILCFNFDVLFLRLYDMTYFSTLSVSTIKLILLFQPPFQTLPDVSFELDTILRHQSSFSCL
jgi:hypothetical protein